MFAAHRCVPLDNSTTLVRRVLVDSSARMLRGSSIRKLSTSNRMDMTCDTTRAYVTTHSSLGT